jgi:hypothetical protein
MRCAFWTCWWLGWGWVFTCLWNAGGSALAAGLGDPAALPPPAGWTEEPVGQTGWVDKELFRPTSGPGCPSGSCPLPKDQEFPNTRAHPAVCRVIHRLWGGLVALGTGVLVDKEGEYGLIITCQHLFREGLGKVTVVFPDGEAFEARLVHQDRAGDLAALVIARPSAEPVRVAGTPPQPGEPVQSCGYGPDGRYWCNQGRVVGYSQTAQTTGWETLEITGRARQGDSGGPIFNSQGELVAILWGTDGRSVSGTYSGRVDRFLQQTGRYLLPWNAKNDPAHRGPSDRAPANPPCSPANPAGGPSGPVPVPGVSGGISAADLSRIESRLDRILELLSGAGQPGQPARSNPSSNVPRGGGEPGVKPAEQAVPSAGQSLQPGVADNQAAASLFRQAVQQLVGELGSLPDRIQARLEKVQAAGAPTTPETIRAYVQDFLSEKLADGSLGWTMGKLLAAALGLSGPVALGLTVGAWLIGRRIGRKVQAGEPLLVQQLAERILAHLRPSSPASASGNASP